MPTRQMFPPWRGTTAPHPHPVLSVAAVDRLAVLPTGLVGLWPLQPTAGRFEVVDDEVRFVPRFPPVPGVDGPRQRISHGAPPSIVASPIQLAITVYIGSDWLR